MLALATKSKTSKGGGWVEVVYTYSRDTIRWVRKFDDIHIFTQVKLCTLVIPCIQPTFQPLIPFIQPSHSSCSSSPAATHPIHPAQPLPACLNNPVQPHPCHNSALSYSPPPPWFPLFISHIYFLPLFFFFFISLHTAYYLTTLYYLYTPPITNLYTPPITNMDSIPLITQPRSLGVHLSPPHLLQQSFDPHCLLYHLYILFIS